MKKQVIAIVIIILFLTMCLSGCDEFFGSKRFTEENRFVGTWLTDSYYDALKIFSNGKCKKFTYDGEWSIEKGKLFITYAIGKNSINHTYNYLFSNNNNTLTLTNVDTGYKLTYNRKGYNPKGENTTRT